MMNLWLRLRLWLERLRYGDPAKRFPEFHARVNEHQQCRCVTMPVQRGRGDDG